MNSVLASALIGVGSLCGMIVLLFYLYSKERGKRLLLEADKKQTEADQSLNKVANEELDRKKKTLRKRPKTIDPLNPWEGVPDREKDK